MVAELGANATVKRYDNGYHMLLRDLDGERRWADVAAWVETQAQMRMGIALKMR